VLKIDIPSGKNIAEENLLDIRGIDTFSTLHSSYICHELVYVHIRIFPLSHL
jgi:hypothetical protein